MPLWSEIHTLVIDLYYTSVVGNAYLFSFIHVIYIIPLWSEIHTLVINLCDLYYTSVVGNSHPFLFIYVTYIVLSKYENHI